MNAAPYSVKNLRLSTALLLFLAVVALADWLGTGHQIAGLLLLCLVFLAARWLPRGWRWLLAALLWFSVAVAVLAVAQMSVVYRANGPFRSPNFLGWFSVTCFFLAADARFLAGTPIEAPTGTSQPRAFTQSSVWAAANLLSLALSNSRASMLALAAGLPFLAPWRWRWPALTVGALCILAAALTRSTSEQGRAGIWRTGYQIWVQRPLLGYGQGGVSVLGMVGFFSVPLDLMLAAGLLGLMAGCWLYWCAWRATREDPAMRGFLVAWVVNSLFLYGTPAVFMPLFLVLGRLSREEQRDARHDAQRCRHDADQPEAVWLDPQRREVQ